MLYGERLKSMNVLDNFSAHKQTKFIIDVSFVLQW
jgi:hypothetical protein